MGLGRDWSPMPPRPLKPKVLNPRKYMSPFSRGNFHSRPPETQLSLGARRPSVPPIYTHLLTYKTLYGLRVLCCTSRPRNDIQSLLWHTITSDLMLGHSLPQRRGGGREK